MMCAEYPQSFLEWLAKRTPNVQARLLRQNPPPLDPGARLRGYHPHKRSADHWRGLLGKRQFIKAFSREAWAALPRCCVIHDGHRKSVNAETVRIIRYVRHEGKKANG